MGVRRKDYRDPRTMSEEENYQYLLDNMIEHMQALKIMQYDETRMQGLVFIWGFMADLVPEEEGSTH